MKKVKQALKDVLHIDNEEGGHGALTIVGTRSSRSYKFLPVVVCASKAANFWITLSSSEEEEEEAPCTSPPFGSETPPSQRHH
jgi:hypothetical protein